MNDIPISGWFAGGAGVKRMALLLVACAGTAAVPNAALIRQLDEYHLNTLRMMPPVAAAEGLTRPAPVKATRLPRVADCPAARRNLGRDFCGEDL